ncbi:MAG: hypothetical protein HY862_16430 [Chloroflexi bacterium]|nr:hypothetical protein [Chloroflexota bacterium]
MVAETKRRRKIVVDGRSYMWRIKDSNDPAGWLCWSYELVVASEDRRFYANYPILPKGELPFIWITGKEFKPTPPHPDNKYRCPRFEREDGAITPQSVKGLIQWCLSDGEPKIRVDWNNKPI